MPAARRATVAGVLTVVSPSRPGGSRSLVRQGRQEEREDADVEDHRDRTDDDPHDEARHREPATGVRVARRLTLARGAQAESREDDARDRRDDGNDEPPDGRGEEPGEGEA